MVIIRAAVVVALVLIAGCASQQTPPPPVPSPLWGYWLTEDGESVVELKACKGDALATCGDLVHFAGPPNTRDYLNGNWLDWGRRLCSAEVVYGLQPDVAGVTWRTGRLYDPDVGETYHLRGELQKDVLLLHAFYGADSSEAVGMAIDAVISGPGIWAATSFLTRALIGEKSLGEDIVWKRVSPPLTRCDADSEH